MNNQLSFWNVKYPFKDFMVISSKGEINSDEIYNINNKLRENNLSVFKMNKYGDINNYIVSDKEAEELNKKQIIFSGMAIYKKQFYFGQEDINIDLENDIFDTQGNFTMVNSNEKSMTIGQDLFGCGNLFYAEYKDRLYISNRYHLLLVVLSLFGYKGELDIRKTISWLYFANIDLFNYNSYKNMDIKGVYNLSLDKNIEINENGWFFNDKKSIINALAGYSERDYKDMIDIGANDIIENIKAIMDNKRFSKYVVDLSGGFDSRLTFSALTNIENWNENIEVNIRKTVIDLDAEIGNSIRKAFSAKLYNYEGEYIYPSKLEEQLETWRSYFMGVYHRMGVGSWSNKSDNKSGIRLTGGQGEVYRAKYLRGVYSNIIKNSETIEDLSENITDRFNLYLKDEKYLKEISSMLASSLSELPGKDIYEKLENHYICFYLRYHFGMSAYDSYNNAPLYPVLMSKNALTASRMINYKDRISERFMIEMTEYLNSILAWVPYGDGKIDSKSILKSIDLKHKEFKNYNFKIDYDLNDLEKQEQINNERKDKLKTKQDREFYDEWRDSKKIIFKETINGYYKLVEYYKSIGIDLVYDINIINENSKDLNMYYSKIMSLVDQINIFK